MIKNLKNIKASGIENIPAEVWKAGMCNEQLLYICNRVYNQQPVDIWRKSCTIPLPKKVTFALLPTTEELVNSNCSQNIQQTTITQDQTSTRKYTS